MPFFRQPAPRELFEHTYLAHACERPDGHWWGGRLVYCFGQIGLAIAELTG
jgi:hypothetical protein